MLSVLQELQSEIDDIMSTLDYEAGIFAHSAKRKELLVQARHRLKQAWHLLDEAAEI